MDNVISVIEKSNQRGGRMLSVLDLFIPISLKREGLIRIPRIQRIFQYSEGKWHSVKQDEFSDLELSIAGWLSDMLDTNIRTIQEVRSRWLAWWENL